jgi:predicted DNA-binding transcriptional regulator AlpA
MRGQPLMSDGLVALGDIARMAGANIETVKKWADRGQLPEPVAVTSGGRIWFRSDVEAWLTQERPRPTGSGTG